MNRVEKLALKVSFHSSHFDSKLWMIFSHFLLSKWWQFVKSLQSIDFIYEIP